ncbi:MAG TPA: AAA-like domain-containing protein, partial [Allocoleopsis sp.]
LGQEWRDIADFSSEEKAPDQDVTKPQYIVISDRSNHSLGSQLEKGLTSAGLNVFLVGKHTEVNGYLKQADYLLLLLSVESIFNELVISELQNAKDLHHKQPLKPIILPVFINFSLDYILPFDLWGYLQGITVWNWLDDHQITDLITELLLVFKEHRQTLPHNHKFTIDVSQKKSVSDVNIPPLSSAIPEVTGGQIELDSRFYIQRFPIEQRCLETISQPGALIRIKAPRQMGKSSLLARILAQAEKQGDRTVCLSFQLANQRIFQSSDAFLQWFCASISLELGLLNPEQLSKYWQLAEMIGSNQCCKAYFEQYLLPQINVPLTLGLDEVDRVFEQPEIADDFFGLLRSLH